MNLNRLPVSEPQSGLVGAAGVSEPAENDGLARIESTAGHVFQVSREGE